MSINKILKQILSLLPAKFQREIFWYKNRVTRNAVVKKWESEVRKSNPPHQFKQLQIEMISKRNHLDYLVETGTFLGHMIEAQRRSFTRLYSIEVEPTLYTNAKDYFKDYKHIHIVKGDSAYQLGEIIGELKNKSIMFWLDGHYSGGITGMGETQCPIYKELETIFNNATGSHYILIDDARCFDGTNDFPTIDELKDFVDRRNKGLKVFVENDLIHIYSMT